MSTVYLLHFERPISANHTTQHYLGSTRDLDTRLHQHQTGQSQARLPTVAHDLGIDMILARTWPGGRDLERRLKNRHEGKRLCPICNPRALARATAKEL
ncbi:MAG: GIY-YIG nuclease family protein [Anaerolineales bacterium]|nr:GIY-YIG nuclease family protein [Anaerolineales bacterium]